jgi:hypothetical protein
MKELLEACQKFISQISPNGDERYFDIDPQDLKEFCDVVEAVQQSVQSDKACTCIKPGYFPRRVNDLCLECGGSISLAAKANH